MGTSIILDVDTGIDDALAILFAVKHPALKLLAVTCTAGNASLEQVIQNTMKVLDIAGAANIPVSGGAQRPLVEPARNAGHVHGNNGLADLELPDSRRTAVPQHAVQLMHDVLSTETSPVTVVGLAPFTNIAMLLRTYPGIAQKIARIVLMGGAIGVGNATASAEFNVWHDPEAAHIVLNAGIPVTMYTLDAFESVRVPAKTAQIWANSSSPRTAFIGQLLKHPRVETDGSAGTSFGLLGDAGAVVALVAPQLMQSANYPVFVDLSPGAGRGQTHVDRRTETGEDKLHSLTTPWPSIEVIYATDADEVLNLFRKTLQLEESPLERKPA